MKQLLKVTLLSSVAVSFLAAGTAPKEYPEGPVGEMVKLGEDIILHTDTHPLTKDFVGNKLNCANCHLKGEDGKPGTAGSISSWLDTATAFPAWSKREKSVQTLQDRSNNCFMRSMNGKRLIIDSKASIAIAAYITWLSEGKPVKMDRKGPWGPTNAKIWPKGIKHFKPIFKKATHENYENGKKIYAAKCASCHGDHGQGMGTFPPLWGKDANGKWLSYNTGAGMSKLPKGATWIQLKMPLGQGGTLSDQEAADVTLYVDAQPRADFDLQKALLPKEEMGVYNSNVLKEKHSVRSNFKALGLDIDAIRGDKVIK
ncbi:MAG TPA: c-type cytochrome [Nitratifractor sp.]|nr:c-type cytochrome [Nitratifractor sp.]